MPPRKKPGPKAKKPMSPPRKTFDHFRYEGTDPRAKARVVNRFSRLVAPVEHLQKRRS